MADVESLLRGAQAELDALNAVSEDLPTLATDALVEGLDTPTLRILAGEPSTSFAALDNRDLFRKVLEELRREPFSRQPRERLREFSSCGLVDVHDEAISLMRGRPDLPWSTAGSAQKSGFCGQSDRSVRLSAELPLLLSKLGTAAFGDDEAY